VSLRDQSTSWSFIVGVGSDAYLRKGYSFPLFGSANAVLGGRPVPAGLSLVNTSNFSTPNYIASSPQSYYSGGPTHLSAPLHAIVPQAPTVSSVGGSSSGGGYGTPGSVYTNFVPANTHSACGTLCQ
jgi:hypothetical protein